MASEARPAHPYPPNLLRRISHSKFSLPELPPPHPYPASMPVPGISRHLLQVLADAFEFELEQERQLQLKGAETLPPEWTACLKRERQEILNKIQQMELLEEHSTPPSAELPHSTHTQLPWQLPEPHVPRGTPRDRTQPQPSRQMGQTKRRKGI